MPPKTRFFTIRLALLTLVTLLLLILLIWYRGSGTPLSTPEVNRLMERIEQQTQVPGARHNLAELRAFLASDDGQPFYTVNLYRYFEQAQYLAPQAVPVSGRQAYDRFSRVMVALQARYGSHAVFGTDWIDVNRSAWDRLVIVRYRSRRDIAELFASDAFADASADKWASLERHERLLVQGVHLPELTVILLPLLAGLVIYLCMGLRAKRHSWARQPAGQPEAAVPKLATDPGRPVAPQSRPCNDDHPLRRE